MTETQQRALEEVLALQELTRKTGTKTTRTVNKVLQALPDGDLTVVAQALRHTESN